MTQRMMLRAAQRRQSFPVQLVDLTLMQLANWRWSWRGALLTGLIAPLLSTAALGVYARESGASDHGAEALGYIVTGSMVMSLLFGTFDRVAGHFAYMRIVGRLEFFATLPITRVALILATVAAFMALALPSVAVTLGVAALLLDVDLHLSPLLLVVVPLIGMALCGLGALIGIVVQTPQEVGNLSALTTFMLVGFGPVILPPDRLPEFVLTLGYLSPATYAASALRQTVLGAYGRSPLWVDLAVLAVFLGLSLWVVGRRMDWRGRGSS